MFTGPDIPASSSIFHGDFPKALGPPAAKLAFCLGKKAGHLLPKWSWLVVSLFQWEFQDPKMEVPTIYKAYIRPM